MSRSKTGNPAHWLKRLRYTFLSVASIAVLLGPVRLIATHPQQVSDALLRLGGRVIGAGSNKPRVIIGVSVVVLVAVWLGVMLRCVWEGRTQSE